MYTFFKSAKYSKYFSFFLQFCILNTSYYSYSGNSNIQREPAEYNSFLPLFDNFNYEDNLQEIEAHNDNEIRDIKEKNSPTVNYFKIKPVTGKEIGSFNSDIPQGKIGRANKNDFDNVSDNIFKVNINLSEVPKNRDFYLVYDLKGIDKTTLPARSVNYNNVTGGYIIKHNNEWQNVEEKLPKNWLTSGVNSIFFSVPNNADYVYYVKNLKIVTKEKNTTESNFEIRNLIGFNNKNRGIYVNGFLNKQLKDYSNYKIKINDVEINLFDNQFEYQLNDVVEDKIEINLFKNNRLIESKELLVKEFISPDKQFSIETLKTVDNASFKNYVLYEASKKPIEELRKIDIPQFESNFVNVTTGESTFRVKSLQLKDSTTFKLYLEYDSKLIPDGYSIDDIQTFHFDKGYKKWLPVQKDTLDLDSNIIVSISDKEGDYVNGIIKTPESPQTSSFTPTMMNDIKAADPSAEMTIISPPEVSQKGDANISFPIKIPSGRNGLQPQVALQYNSEGGNSWVGQGWNISMPAITIDTKWGTPTFDSEFESEIYTLNGEQLMYPKHNGEDWMPNRHYDVDGAPAGTFSTQPISRVSNLEFTPRKQGSFSKIERIGSSTNQYFWKVTSTDGTIYWYGGKNSVVNNSVIKNANNNIVHWGLYMVEDVHGNTIKYTYSNFTVPNQSGINANLNGGKVFHINRIQYSGYNDSDYKYEVRFIRNPIIRQDVSINARLGVKQIEPYLLKEIRIRNINSSSLSTIRKYTFEIGTGKFNKAQLRSISEYKGNLFFYKHEFDYYDDITVDDEDVYYTDGEIEVICSDENVDPCPDNDNDGVCNDVDLCPDTPGSVDNDGCPDVRERCYQITIPSSANLNECLAVGVQVKINGIVLLGGPFYSINDIVSAMQAQHPVTSYSSSQGIIRIDNTTQVYSSLVIYDSKGTCFSGSFIDCLTGKISSGEVYRQFFSDLASSNTFTIEDGDDPNNPCDNIITNDEFIISGYAPSFDSSASSLGSTKSEAISGGFYIGIGIGSNRFTKMTTFGVQWNWGNDKSMAFTSLIDINGDGLSDIVRRVGSSLYYKKHVITRTYDENNEPVVTHSFESLKPITGINNFYRAFGRSKSRNFQVTFGYGRAGGFVGKDKSTNKSETDIYFTDGNGDGLMDIVRDGVVYFNRLDANGNPDFIPDSQGSENLIITAAPMDIEIPEEYNEDEIELPAFDVVKVWEAPIDGNIQIENSITLTDPTKESIVSIEMKDANSFCSNVNFTAPYVTDTMYRYEFDWGILQTYGGSNPFDSSVYGICNPRAFRIKNIEINSNIFSPSNPDLLFLTHGNSVVGYQNQCPNYLPQYCPVFNSNDPNCADPSPRSLDSDIIIENWFSNVLNTMNIPFSVLSVRNNSYNRLDLASLYGGVPSSFDYVYSNGAIYNIQFNSSQALTGACTLESRYQTTGWVEGTSSINGYTPLDIIYQYQTNIGLDTEVYVNGDLLGIFNLFNDFPTFLSAFESIYGNTYSVVAPMASNNYSISITMSDGTIGFNTITLVPTSNPQQSTTYNFTDIDCYGERINPTNTFASNNNPYEDVEYSSTEQQFANKKWIAEGNELNLPYGDVKQNYQFDFTNNGVYNSISGEYYLNVNGNSYAWYDNQGNIVNSNSKKNKLFELSGFNKNTFINELTLANNERIDSERQESQQDAINWLNNYNQSQNVISTSSINNGFRTVNQTDCSISNDDLCLLYGAELNSSNTSIVNTITANCSGEKTISVRKGDRIYFRVHSVDNGNPPVDWDPKVEYTDLGYNTITDANGHTPFSSSYSDGFVLTNKLPTTFPGDSGIAKINWDSFTVNPTDTVTYQIIKEVVAAGSNDESPLVISSEIIYTKVCNPNIATVVDAVASPIDLNNINISSVTGYSTSFQQTHFYFKVISTSNIDWKSAVWKPELECITTTPIDAGPDDTNNNGNLTSEIKLYPVPDYDLYRIYPCGTTFVKKDISSIASQPGLRITPNLSGIFNSSDNGIINFVVKRGNEFKDSRVFTVTNGVVSGIPSPIMLGNTGASDIEIMYTVDDSDSDGSSDSLLNKLALSSNVLAVIRYKNVSINVYKDELTLYQKINPIHGSFFRQWGQFMYNPDNVEGAIPSGIADTNLINEDALFVSLSQSEVIDLESDLNGINDDMTEADLDAFEASHMNYINNIAFLQANPSREITNGVITDRWIGLHRENYASEFSYRAASLEQSVFDLEEGFESIEQGVLQTGAYAISKYAKGHANNNFSGGVSAYGVGAQLSRSRGGYSNMLTDYVDYNGDRYPDIVSTNKVQYTNKTGGLLAVSSRPDQPVSKSSSESWGFGASGSFGKSSDDGGDKSGKKFGFERFDGFRGNSGGGISGSFQDGESVTERSWTDINGDGLSDLLETTSSGTTNVTLNFGPITPNNLNTNWGSLPIFKSDSNGISGGVGINKWNGSVEAGVALTSSWNKTRNTLIDINGDGLLDLIYTDDDLGVKINTGNKFVDHGVWTSQYDLDRETVSVAASLNAGFTFALVWNLWLVTLKIPAVNINGTPISTTTNKTMKTMTDYDGDGYADLLEKVGPNTIKIYHSRIRRTDKLKSVTNPLGGKFTIDYKVQKVDYNNPNPKWVMSSIEVDDNYDKVNDGEDIYKKQFEYEEGRYDRREREFYGYKKVKTIDLKLDEDGNEEVYRTNISLYNNQSYFLNGLMLENYVIKGDDENQKFFKDINYYSLYKLNDTNDEIDFSTVLPDTYDVGGHEGRRSACVLLTKTRKEVYELNPSTNFVTEIEFNYDSKGRVTKYLNRGDLANNTDDYQSEIKYHTLTAPHILSVPESIVVSEVNSGIVKRERKTEVEPANGNILKIRARNNSNWAETEMQYDNYGNLTYIKNPEDSNGQSTSYTYEYDSDFNKYAVKIIDNSFGYESTAVYDSNFDKPLEVTDIAGNKTLYEYDNFGRTKKVVGPKEIASGQDYTIKFIYYTSQSALPSSANVSVDDFVPVALTKHFDVQHPNNDIETYTFVDGLGRPIQVKKDIEINTGAYNSPTLVEALGVSGKVKYDKYGRSIQSYQPWWEDKTQTTKFLVNEYDTGISAKVEYDELDRSIKSINEEGNEATVQFSIDTDASGVLCLKTTNDVDQNGSQHIITETYNDITGKLMSTNNIGGTTGSIWTKYSYNAIGELLTYTDAENMTTSYEYDMFGRKLEVNHPDNGTTKYTYDNVNLVELQTQKLLDQSTKVLYNYDHGRLQEVIFPDMPTGTNLSNVYYDYGNSGNQTGRVVAIKDATGLQEFTYGDMGETLEVNRTIVAPNLPTRQFKTAFEYDSFNRIQTLTYPDGEEVTYTYNRGGNLKKMSTLLNGQNYDYIKRIDYDYFEQKSYVKYGNNTETFYDYTTELRRLDNLLVKASDGQSMFDNTYTYDKVGNITNTVNNASYNTTNYLGGVSANQYTYDNLNRLTRAIGIFQGYIVGRENQDNRKAYDLEMTYNDTHGIVKKKQLHTTQGYLPVYENSYTNEYSYEAGTHKVEKVENTEDNTAEYIKYDANGNMLSSKNNDGYYRSLYWDESNRLRVVNTDKKYMQHYIYDGSGVRTLKATSKLESVYENGQIASTSTTMGLYTTYVNQYMVVDPDQRYSKHYFSGSERVVAQMGTQDASIFDVATAPVALKQGNNAVQNSSAPIDFDALRNLQIADLDFYVNQSQSNQQTTRVNVKFKKFETSKNTETERPAAPELYYFHSDHLGTGTFLSDIGGNPYQFFLNLPFGETMIEQHSYSGDYTNRYKFNGKELDEETGYYYYGARYYNPRLSLWLSVDPMALKFPNWNPYNYTMQNPINLIDPSGMEPEEGGGGPKGTYVIIYAAGFDNPIAKSHNQGDNFKKNAEARKQSLIDSGVPESSIVLSPAFTENEFLNVVNKEYESGKIVSLDIYSHMSNNAINFGGYENMESESSLPPDKDYRLLSFWSNGGSMGYNPDGDNEILKINSSNFENGSKINLWGCNAGYYFNDESKKQFALAQGFANHLNSTVGAFESYSEFKQTKSGKLIFDGTMIMTKDRKTQRVNQTFFNPNNP